ncbi:MAG: sensor domain-containing diguanylate cyclase [Acidiferrobacter sp.]
MRPDGSHGEVEGTGFDWLMQIAYLAGKSLDLDEVLPAALSAIAEHIPSEHVVVLQLDKDVMDVRARWSRLGAVTVVEKCAFKRTHELSLGDLDIIHALPDKDIPGLPYLTEKPKTGSCMVALTVPLAVDYVCVGRLDFIRSAASEEFSPWERYFAQACGRILALSIRNCTEYARVAWLAEHDPLTGIGNRRNFDIALNRELARAERYRRDVSLLLIDLDDFKEANTHLGLSGGDEILRRTAKVLAERARKGVDISCRIGGDEFAMILPEISERLADDLAVRLVKDVAQATMSLWPMRFSYSISTYPATSAELLRRAADAKLLAAKRKKGRIVVPVRGAVQ